MGILQLLLTFDKQIEKDYAVIMSENYSFFKSSILI